MKVVKKYHRAQCCICLENYGHSKCRTAPFLYSTDGCTHRVCQSCMEAYADHSVSQWRDNRISTLVCPVQDCAQTFQLDQVISKTLPFRHRLVFWWRQMKLRLLQDTKNNQTKETKVALGRGSRDLNIKSVTKTPLARSRLPTRASNVRSNKQSCNLVVAPPKARNMKQPKITWTVTEDKSNESKTQSGNTKDRKVISDSATSSSLRDKKPRKGLPEEFVELALARNWSRCPSCRHAVERISGCNYIYCRCGTGFCYRCGSSSGYYCTEACRGGNLKLNDIRKAMFQN
ncbi:hypothetical protein BJV82DRAFT_698046 [Fennellomyces sp. T-0311]|nr:hypothetical protein BJV82DRAFT_698046 [Fennellomyces sp. T-0311]